MRRLAHLGALALKRSAYLLPASDTTLEDFQWLRQEIVKEGGDAWILESRFVGGFRNDEIREKFRELRSRSYQVLAAEGRALLDRMRVSGDAGELRSAVDSERRRLARRIDATRAIDFFHADGRNEVEALMAAIDRLGDSAREPHELPPPQELRGRTWATRAGVKVDRIASAWLIRRFIDPAATLVFVRPGDPPPAAGVLRFDMFEGEFTHEGDRCTFEVLLESSGEAADDALRSIAQIVHDIDLRDARYQRPETAGVAALIEGLTSRFDDDHRRVTEGAAIFETLFASLATEHSRPPAQN